MLNICSEVKYAEIIISLIIIKIQCVRIELRKKYIN